MNVFGRMWNHDYFKWATHRNRSHILLWAIYEQGWAKNFDLVLIIYFISLKKHSVILIFDFSILILVFILFLVTIAKYMQIFTELV